MPYFFLKTVFRRHHVDLRVGQVSHEEEEFVGRYKIRRIPSGFKTSYDYFVYARPKVLSAQGKEGTLYYAYGALRFLFKETTRENIHSSLVFPLHLIYFTRGGCDKISSECNRLREKVIRLTIDDNEEGFYNGVETIGFADAINIGLEGECPSWIGNVSKGIISCEIIAVLENKGVGDEEKRKFKWIYRLLKSRHLIASAHPFISNEHNEEDLEALRASYEVLLDYDNNLFYRIGYRKIIKVMEETKCSLERESILKSNVALKPQLFH